MKASETRQKARDFLKTLSGKYQLFIVSIMLAIFTISISYRQTIFSASTGTDLTLRNPFQVSLECFLHYFLHQQAMQYLMSFALNVTTSK